MVHATFLPSSIDGATILLHTIVRYLTCLKLCEAAAFADRAMGPYGCVRTFVWEGISVTERPKGHFP